MSLKEHDKSIKSEYRSLIDNVVQDFYIPLLKEAVEYKRAVGFFSSTALVEISKGIASMAANGGKIQIVASPYLNDADIEAIKEGYEDREKIIEGALMRSLSDDHIDHFSSERLNLLANLIANGTLDIRIAFTEDKNGIGMYHEKMGIIQDEEGNRIAFSGSMNESSTAMSYNYETIDVFKEWHSSDEKERVELKNQAFSSIWNDLEPNIKVMSFPNISQVLIDKYKKKAPNFEIDNEEFESVENQDLSNRCKENFDEYFTKTNGPEIPSDVELREYQNQAIDNWMDNKCCGIFDMATGTGKTYTALAAASRLYENLNKNLAIIIVCPYQHLVEQWKDDIVAFNMKPIVCYSASKQRKWKDSLKTAARSFNLGLKEHFCMVTTNATFATPYVQKIVKNLHGNVLIIVDEAHNFGAKNLNKTLIPNIPFRLALSATIDRHGDPEGTQHLYDYFGEKCIEYTLKEAINNGMLTPYYYYPIVVSLSTEELDEYLDISKSISKNIHSDKNGKIKISDYAKMLLIKRARLVAGANEKVAKLREIIQNYKDDNHMLVYCGATTVQDVDYQENKIQVDEMRQIDVVTDLLGNECGMGVSKFTSEEDAEERNRIKEDFDEGKHLQALIAIRCLDEGVNIPSIKTAFILASSTNPKEYVQRRGRVLRKYPGKEHAVIYDFITLPVPIDETVPRSSDFLSSAKSLAIREIERVKDFSEIAENPFDSDKLISDIKNKFAIEETDKEDNIYA